MAQDSLFRPQFALKIPLQGEKSGFFLPSEGCKASAFHQFLIFCKRLTAPSLPSRRQPFAEQQLLPGEQLCLRNGLALTALRRSQFLRRGL